MNAAVLEVESGAGDQILKHARRQNLTWAGQLGYSRGNMNGDSPDVIRQYFDLAGMQSGPNLQTKVAHSIADSFRTTHAAGRAVKRGQKPISKSLDFFSTKSDEFATHTRVMSLQQMAPLAVTE